MLNLSILGLNNFKLNSVTLAEKKSLTKLLAVAKFMVSLFVLGKLLYTSSIHKLLIL